MGRRLAIGPAVVGAVALLGSTPLVGQQLEAEVDRNSVRLNESFTYTLRAQGEAPGDPQFEVLAGCCEILRQSRNTRIQAFNNSYDRVTEWQLMMMAREAGTITIPPVPIGSVRSNSITIQVMPAESSEAPGDIFIEVEATPQHPYVQAETVYAVRLFIGVDIRGPRLSEPEVSGGEAIVEKLGEDRRYQTERDGREFAVVEQRFAVFPQQAGSLTIEPLTFETQVMDGRRFSRIQRFRSDAIELMVKPVQAPPAEFPGADWLPARALTIEEQWSEAGEPLVAGIPRTRTLTVEADGLLDTQLPELNLGNANGARQYKDQPALQIYVTADGIRGSRTETMAVIAGEPGDFALPAVKLPWFDVIEERWQVARVAARDVTVLANAEQTEAAVMGAAQSPLLASPSDLPAPGPWRGLTGLFAAGWALTAALWLASSARRRKERPKATDAAPRRPQQRRILSQLRASCRDNDAGRARDLLLEWGTLRFGDRAPRNLAALSKRVSATLAQPLLELERHLYGPVQSAWSGAELLTAMKSIDAVGGPAKGETRGDLVPLYR